MNCRFPLLFLACSSLLIADAAEIRTFRSEAGKTVRARFEGLNDGKVTIRNESGQTFVMALETLDKANVDYVKTIAAELEKVSLKLNQAAGHNLATLAPFDGRPAKDLADALQLRPESQTTYGASWRLYSSFVDGYRLFNAMPYSVALYSDSAGLASHLSIVYANKGDFGNKSGFGEEHFKEGETPTEDALNKAMEKDAAAITSSITSALGEGVSQRYGEGKSRRTVTRWNWHGHAFLLSHETNEYVGLSVVPSTHADAGGKSARITDSNLKARLAKSVIRDENGDVHLSGIPMVNQGPKGYCVPATFERVMRTMGIEADMYLLAMVGESKAGGGTSVGLLLDKVRSQVYSKGRRTRDDNMKKILIRDIRRFIDDGIPVIWTMCSMPEYNQIANENTEERANAADLKEHAASMENAVAAIVAKDKPDDRHHLCMIIGYNETTGEIAVSDSWGPKFEKRWVPLPVINWVHQGDIFMILP
jgi:hypothetical protein